MTSQGNQDETQAAPIKPQDLATAYREVTKGEQTATQLEAKLTNLESRLDAMLAALDQEDAGAAAQGSSSGGKNGKTTSESNGDGKDA